MRRLFFLIPAAIPVLLISGCHPGKLSVPKAIDTVLTSDGKQLKESADKEGFTTKKLQNGYVLSINHGGKNIAISFT
jgi:hypothetical protein